MDRDLVSLAVELADGRVVGVLVRYEESGLNITAIGVSAAREDEIVQVDVVVIDGIVKSDHNHLGNILRVDISGSLRQGKYMD